MKLGKVVKTVMKYGPIVYPIVKKILNERKNPTVTSTTTRRK